jgi:ribosome-associated protein
METFKLKEGEEYIELNNLLKIFNWVSSGGEGKTAIREGHVTVNGETESRIRKKMRVGDTVNFNGEEGKVE